jgi:ferredoxin
MEVEMKVVVNRDNCIGCGACEALYPEMFQIDDEGLSKALDNENIDEAKLTEVIEGCPTSAISKEECSCCCNKEEE